jgi:hypothetical protein
MAIKRPKPEEIVVKLRQVEVLVGQYSMPIDTDYLSTNCRITDLFEAPPKPPSRLLEARLQLDRGLDRKLRIQQIEHGHRGVLV